MMEKNTEEKRGSGRWTVDFVLRGANKIAPDNPNLCWGNAHLCVCVCVSGPTMHLGGVIKPRTQQGVSPQFPGVLVLVPFPFASAIKCHQKITCNSAGSSVGSLAPPRATPRLGGAVVSCQYFPCSFVLALRELGLRLGVKSPLPLRASSRGVLTGAGALAGYRTPIQPVCPSWLH
jgi:hypothetical protein